MSTSRWKRGLLILLNPKVGIPLAIALLVLSAPFVYRSRQLSGLPDPGDPFDVEAFGTVEISDAENAFVEYRAAAALMVPVKGVVDITDWDKAWEDGWTGASKEIRQWVDDNRPALKLWRKGTEKPDALSCQPKDLLVRMSDYTSLRQFFRLALLESSRQVHLGDMNEAWSWYRAIFRSSRHCGRHSGGVGRFVGSALHEPVTEAMVEWAADPRVDAAQLRRALRNVRGDFQMTPKTSDAFKADFVSTMIVINQFNLTELSEFSSLDFPGGSLVLFAKNEPELSRRVARQALTNWLSQIDLQRHARAPIRRGQLDLFDLPLGSKASPTHLSAEEIDRFFNRSIIAKDWLSATMGVDVAITRDRGYQAALEVTLALQWYHREHGEFPTTLKVLLEGYLEKILNDPFARTVEPMRYRRDQGAAVVWSIGEDEIDNGGDVVHGSSKRATDVGFRVVPPTKQSP